ncbi:NUDIX hydrolase [Clostridium sp. E02]|uniref:NUDIX hydrolase n=1 Tax=Clostridium sp. E02 TaxID=2487134 RepID=UPI000F531E4E|nr:NUDIX hydrolase [Clostridium sp. E02]
MDHKKKFLKTIKDYIPYNEQERADKEMILRFLMERDSVYFRENQAAHISTSGWILNQTHDRILMAYHNIYNSWAWTGGHADGETDLLSVAIREAKEETGIVTVKPLFEEPFSIEVLTVDGHEKKGKYVSSHLHLNITYLLEADDRERTQKKEDENSAVDWFSIADCIKEVSEPWMKERIYEKIIAKMAIIFE